MKLRIKNYKSIVDLELNLKHKINYIIGKNESGKSNILDAIFEITQERINESKQNFNNSNKVEIDYTYKIFGELKNKWKKDFNIDNISIDKVIHNEFNGYYYKQNFNKELKSQIEKFYDVSQVNDSIIIRNILENRLKLKNNKIDENQLIKKAQELLFDSTHIANMYDIKVYNQENFPYLKREYTFDEAKNDNTFIALWKLLKQDTKDIDNLIKLEISGDERLDKIKELEKNLGVKLDSFVSDFWKQETISLMIDIRDDKFIIRAADKFGNKEGKYRDLDIRSEGMKSYITLILFIASLDTNKKNIILLDEPGHRLHASAIKNMRYFLETRHNNIQFVIATHNPAFLDWKNIDQFSLAIKKDKDKGTELINSFFSRSIGEEKSGLSPFLYQLGLNDNSLFSISENINVFVEGAQDSILLKSMYHLYKNKEKKKNDINFIPLGSASKDNSLISLSFTTNKKLPFFIFDNDIAGSDGKNNIKKWYFNNQDTEQIFFITGKNTYDSNFKKIETQTLFGDSIFESKKIKDNKSFVYYLRLSNAIKSKKFSPNDEVYKKFKLLFDRIKPVIF